MTQTKITEGQEKTGQLSDGQLSASLLSSITDPRYLY